MLVGGGNQRCAQADVGLAGGVLKVDLGVTRWVRLQQHLAVILPTFVGAAALRVGVVKHVVDAFCRVGIPSRKHQQMRAFGELRLAICLGLELGAHFRVGHHDDFIRLQTAGSRCQTCSFQNTLHILLRHCSGRVHFLGGVAPLESAD